MNPRLENVPDLEHCVTSVAAKRFNLARVALRRLANPLQIKLSRLRGLELMLADAAWIVIDWALNDLPVLAWLDFDVRTRGLHEPVPCVLNLYHAHGVIIVDMMLEEMPLIIGERLAKAYPQANGDATVLKGNGEKTRFVKIRYF